ncbi:MAG: NAD(P)/FAD-dependent oxidoreductase [Actinomycetota bacterium]|nr:NAD(P)/FAD-dependent oxidoreductase [Actinomycetota bacterium]
MNRSIIIIGAGIAGLSAGCYGQMNGYDTHILELHDKPGGLCTSWDRKGYTIDGCIHWLVGTNPSSSMNQMWRELGAIKGKKIINHDEFLHIEGKSDKTFILYTGVDRLEAHMKELAPGDADVIEEFTGAIRFLSRIDMPLGKPREIASPLDGLKAIPMMLPMLRYVMKWRKTSLKDYADRFKDPFLHEVFNVIFDIPDFPLLGLVFTMAWLNNKDAGYPEGGSLEFSRAIEDRYLKLGGEISYKSRVEKILVEGGRAVGVRLSDGGEHRADTVISAADAYATIFDMLDERYIDKEYRKWFDTMPIFEPLVHISVGVAADLSSEPSMLSYPLATPIEVAGKMRDRLNVENTSYDPTLAPSGKSVLIITLESNYPYWERLHEDKEAYRAEKERIADDVVASLETRFPSISGKVEMVDVATPITFKRYTNNWQGSFEGWLLTTDNMSTGIMKGLSRTLPGLDNFYMIGQWTKPGGGLPPAATSGREVIQIMCHREKRPFTTTEP